MYNNILIPTDGSDGVQDAIEEGIALAKQTDATVHALYVIDNRDYGTVPDAEWMGLQGALENAGETAVEAVAERAETAGVETVTAIEEGTPQDEIVEYANEKGIDVIVMGTHGRSGVDRFLLGSVTENVIRRSEVPIHVVRISDSEE
ncbi:MAG TPA: universal stress protein [Halococcus sp.]|nr:universal stress protein [Halococcus sp.]